MNKPLDQFAQRLLDWYEHSGRKDLPWQHPREPYRVWLSEIMLQQTQVTTVIPYFENFLEHFPAVVELANADIDQVLSLWAGLGYYARARNLHAAAIRIRDIHGGELPSGQDELEKLPGVGRSTAGAIRAQAFAQPGVILDANVRRVLCRYHGIDSQPMQTKTQERLWVLAESHTPNQQHADYAQAIMDLGATLCARTAKCESCPLQSGCIAYAENRQNEIPAKPPKKGAKPVRFAYMMILKNEVGEIYLERRPPSGIWGGMLCPPVEYLETQKIDGNKNADALPQRRHSFSHFHLDFVPIISQLGNDLDQQSNRALDSAAGLWYNLNSPPPGGLPAPVSKLFKELINSQ